MARSVSFSDRGLIKRPGRMMKSGIAARTIRLPGYSTALQPCIFVLFHLYEMKILSFFSKFATCIQEVRLFVVTEHDLNWEPSIKLMMAANLELLGLVGNTTQATVINHVPSA